MCGGLCGLAVAGLVDRGGAFDRLELGQVLLAKLIDRDGGAELARGTAKIQLRERR